jgi:hypothetical protein
MKCVPEDKCITQNITSLDTHAASHTSSANITVIAIAVTAGFILVAVAITVVIVLARKKGLARKRGMFEHPASRNDLPEWMCGLVIVE